MSSSIKPKRISAVSKDIVNPIQKFSSKLSKPKANQGIQLILWLDESEQIHTFQVSGHAGFAELGQDIVCAGVSALSIAAVNGLEYFLSQAPKIEESEGYLNCALIGVTEKEIAQAQWILKTMQLGLEEIQQTYGEKYLKIDIRRWTPC